jgi:ABC-type glycerol-3-phosphate transport system permease component
LSSARLAPADRHGREPFAIACRGFAFLWALILIYPILYIVSLSLRPTASFTQAHLGLIPLHFQWSNYSAVFSLFNQFVVSIPRLLMNSAIVTGSAIVGTLIISILAAYAFATMEFPGKKLIFYLVLLGLIVPIPVVLIPEFITVKTYGLIGSRLSLILPYMAFGLPLPLLILTTFFKEIPKELYEAATIDGASPLRRLIDIVLPLARPAIATSVIFLALLFWNEFALALVIIQNPSITTVPLGLASVQGKGGNPWPLIAAAMLITSVPVVILFTAFQRQFIEGLVHGSVKG